VSDRNLRIVMMGPPGCGKGTQGDILQESLGVPHISTGEILRNAGKEGTELGLKAKALIDDGNFVPDDMIIAIIKEALAKPEMQKGFILDGFPRTVPQAEALDVMLAELNAPLDFVFQLQVPDEILAERIVGRYTCTQCGAGYHDRFKTPKFYGVCDKCGNTEFVRRADDNRRTIKARLATYRASTAPVLPYYETKGILYCVDGTGSIVKVKAKIEQIIGV